MPLKNDYLDVTVYPVEANLTLDGIQYGTEIDTAVAGKEVILFEYSFRPPFAGAILWAYFLLGANFKSLVSANETLVWRAQVRRIGYNWIDLFPNANVYNVKSTRWKDAKVEGYAKVSNRNFNKAPFDFRVLFKCNTANGARGRMKNNTMFRVIWKKEEGVE